MQWSDFYDAFWDWSDSTRKTRISSLEDIGSGDEIVDVILEIEDEKVRAQLIRKAMKLGAQFSSDDFMNLDGELSDELFEQLGKYAGYDHNDPYFDEDNMTWDDFYNCYSDWDEAILARRIKKLCHFGTADEVVEAVQSMPNSELEEQLFKKAQAAGVRFTRDHLMELGEWGAVINDVIDNDLSDDAIDQFVADAEELVAQEKRVRRENSRVGFWGTLIGIVSGISAGSKSHDNGRCNGDCENCPAHYGYRYGRWYYGHGHQHGCQRGGNGGATGRTYQD